MIFRLWPHVPTKNGASRCMRQMQTLDIKDAYNACTGSYLDLIINDCLPQFRISHEVFVAAAVPSGMVAVLDPTPPSIGGSRLDPGGQNCYSIKEALLTRPQ